VLSLCVVGLLFVAGCAGLGGPAADPRPSATTAPTETTTTTRWVVSEDGDRERYLVVDRADQSEAARVFNGSDTREEAVRFENLSETERERFLEVYGDPDRRVQRGLSWSDRTRYVYYEGTWWEVVTIQR
jgi:hypothetical protein